MLNPKVSVITPNYNHGHYLPELIEALEHQNPQPFEVIIIDDASTDDSLSIAKNLQVRFPYIRIVSTPQNQGAVASLNRGIDEATGDYLIFRAADDLDLPGHFETALGLLEAHPNVDLFCADLNFFTDTPEDGVIEPIGFSEEPAAFPKAQFPYLFGTRWVNGHTVMIRAEAMRRNGYFSQDLAFVTDWFHFMAAGFRGGFCYAPKALVAARVSPHSYSSRKKTNDEPTRKALSAMLTAILGPYSDTLNAFVKSGALLRFGSALAEAIRSDPKFEPFAPVAKQIEKIQLGESQRESSFGLESAIRQSLQSRLDRLHQYAKQNPQNAFWIYGAGGHTRALLAQWNDLNLPAIKGIITTDQPTSDEAYGLPLSSIDDAPFTAGDAVILSSKSYEGIMANSIQNKGTLQSIAIWNRKLDTLG